MTSPWLHANQIASGPCDEVTLASHSRTAATARIAIAAIGSPPSPGNVTADGWCCTTFHSGSFANCLSGWPSHSPYPHSIRPGSMAGDASGRAVDTVSRHRRNGLVTTAASGTARNRSPTTAAWPKPASSRPTGLRPTRAPAALELVRPCRNRRTIATGQAYDGSSLGCVRRPAGNRLAKGLLTHLPVVLGHGPLARVGPRMVVGQLSIDGHRLAGGAQRGRFAAGPGQTRREVGQRPGEIGQVLIAVVVEQLAVQSNGLERHLKCLFGAAQLGQATAQVQHAGGQVDQVLFAV